MSENEITRGKEVKFENPRWLERWQPYQPEAPKTEVGCATRDELLPPSAKALTKGNATNELLTPIVFRPLCDDVAKVRTKLLMDSDMITPFDKNKDNRLSRLEISDALEGALPIEQKSGLKMLSDNFNDIAGIGGRSKYLQSENISAEDIKLLARAASNRIEMAADPKRARQLQLDDLKSHVFPGTTESIIRGVVFTAIGAGIGYICGGWKLAIGNAVASPGFVMGSRYVEDRMAISSRMERLDKILPGWSTKIGNLTSKDFPSK